MIILRKSNKHINSNKSITCQVINRKDGTHIREIQNFEQPEDYEDAFKKYYPKNDNTYDSIT